MSGDAVIVLAAATEALTIPAEAVYDNDGQKFVYLYRQKNLQIQNVDTGIETDYGGMVQGNTVTGNDAEGIYITYGYGASVLKNTVRDNEIKFGYAVTGEALAGLETESRIITSMDDPMILPAELRKLQRTSALHISLARFGGHCGFVDRLRGPTWIDREVLAELLRD